MQRIRTGRPRLSFWLKLLAAGGLVALADQLFFGKGVGATLGGFAVIWTAAAVALVPPIRRNTTARIAAGAAVLLCVVLFNHPSLTGWTLFWIALTVAVLSPRCAWAGDGWSWTQRVSTHAWLSFVGPIQDSRRLRRLIPPSKISLQALMAMSALPLGGGAIFLALFASANPIIAEALSGLRLPDLTMLFYFRLWFWAAVFLGVWASLRPGRRSARQRQHRTKPANAKAGFEASGLAATSASLALILFNALFGIENALDLAFLWSGAGPPSGITLAQYAHRGAYPLIATALLAAGFSLFFLREGSESAARPLIRRLVVLWVAQNVLLCASSILRTIDYVQAYSLTGFRVAALLWMGLVTIGLALIGWRILQNKSRAWLINANLLALGVVLLGVSVGDLGAVAAAWNVRHARDVGGTGANLDVCYLQGLGSSALLPIIALEQRGVGPALRGRLDDVRRIALANLEIEQGRWSSWTWRGQRRLDAAHAALRHTPAMDAAPIVDCDGRPYALPPHLTPQTKP